MNTIDRDLCSEIVSNRDSFCGKATCLVEKRSFDAVNESIAVTIDRFMQQVGLLGGVNDEISRKQAEEIICYILNKDLAHSVEISQIDYARKHASNFLELFGDDAKFFSNGMLTGKVKGLKQWYPASLATFDTGVVCLDSSKIGILWVEDED